LVPEQNFYDNNLSYSKNAKEFKNNHVALKNSVIYNSKNKRYLYHNILHIQHESNKYV